MATENTISTATFLHERCELYAAKFTASLINRTSSPIEMILRYSAGGEGEHSRLEQVPMRISPYSSELLVHANQVDAVCKIHVYEIVTETSRVYLTIYVSAPRYTNVWGGPVPVVKVSNTAPTMADLKLLYDSYNHKDVHSAENATNKARPTATLCDQAHTIRVVRTFRQFAPGAGHLTIEIEPITRDVAAMQLLSNCCRTCSVGRVAHFGERIT
eukprot:TRINITY_DN10704_c0_g1_i1.p1 TRINITY_DN10704_c0_g1~~TRINITY_DN10704_c0_g1_i1.p1  ORF type:complete len:228 (+),score=14.08 TRINITY_DN10704_c0_g1_i1:40-684(+)